MFTEGDNGGVATIINDASKVETISAREVALAIVPHLTGGLSFTGAAISVGRVLWSQRKRKKTYHQLLCALSLMDLVSSFSYFLSTWPIPADSAYKGVWGSPYNYAAVGNKATCTAQGFGIQLGVTASAFYNVMLSVHYILTIRFNFSEHELKTRCQPCMLSIPLVLGLALSIPGLFLGIYNDSNLWCWIAPN
jgi:hypothetical protein